MRIAHTLSDRFATLYLYMMLFFANVCMCGCSGSGSPGNSTTRVVIATDRNFDKTGKQIAAALASGRREKAVVAPFRAIDFDLPDRARHISEIVGMQPELVIAADTLVVPSLVAAGYHGKVLFLTLKPLQSPEVASLISTDLPLAVVSMHLDVHESCTNWLREFAGLNTRVGIISHPLRSSEMQNSYLDAGGQTLNDVKVFEVATPEEAAGLVRKSGALKIDAWYALHSPAVWRKPELLTAAAIHANRPLAIEYSHYYAEVGSLIACAVEHNLVDAAVNAARLLLAGASPKELTTLAASSMSVAINLETARKLNIVVPMRLAMRADKLIAAKPGTGTVN